jgi:serine/threonine protein kinase
MSRVFVAEELELGRKVVVKVLPPEMAAGVNADRFSREIQLAASLQHPHIVPLLGANLLESLAQVQVAANEFDSAANSLERLLAVPSGVSVEALRFDPRGPLSVLTRVFSSCWRVGEAVPSKRARPDPVWLLSPGC